MNLRLLIFVISLFFTFQVRASDDAVDTVLKLYKDFSWETVFVEPKLIGFIDQPREILQRYLDEHLTNLIIKDRECAKRTHEICSLDFMPLWDSQDAGAKDITVRSTPDPAVVEVTFDFTSSNKKRLLYQLTRTINGWRISDIRAQGWSLLLILERE